MQAIAVVIGAHRLQVEVAANPLRRALGLMFRRSLPDDAGMLFVFPEDAVLSFWMRNTLLPLSVAFLDAKKQILNIADMEPMDDQRFRESIALARYGLEVNQGWFAVRKIGPGASCEFDLPTSLVVS